MFICTLSQKKIWKINKCFGSCLQHKTDTAKWDTAERQDCMEQHGALCRQLHGLKCRANLLHMSNPHIIGVMVSDGVMEWRAKFWLADIWRTEMWVGKLICNQQFKNTFLQCSKVLAMCNMHKTFKSSFQEALITWSEDGYGSRICSPCLAPLERKTCPRRCWRLWSWFLPGWSVHLY